MSLLQSSVSPEFLSIYNEIKFWVGIGGGFFAAYKALDWIKAIREKDLTELRTGVDALGANLTGLGTSMNTSMNKQTDALVAEFRELRNDMRTYVIYQKPKVRVARAAKRTN